MATLRLILGTDPRTLLEAAAEGFLTPDGANAATGTRSRPDGSPSADANGSPDRFPSPRYLLALRQGGLRDDLLAMAAERGVPGWFDPPLCLFQQLPEWLGATDRKPCGDYERVVLLSRLLRESATGMFGRLRRPEAFVDAVDRLFGELLAEGVSPLAFEEALEKRPERDAFERVRDADLAVCYHAYTEALGTPDPRDGRKRRDGRDRLVDCAEAVRADPGALAGRLGGRREIRIFGLQDLRGGWPVLLDALRESPALDRITVYSAVALESFQSLRFDSIERLDPLRGLAARLFGAGAPREPEALPVHVVSAPDADRETEDVARRVRGLLDDGADPRRIAVVARSARPYVDRVLDALAKFGVPATARRRHAFAEIPVVRAILSLFSVAAEGWTRHGLVELAEQPYFGQHSRATAPMRRLDAVVLNHIGYHRRIEGLDAWTEAHEKLYDRARTLEERIKAGEHERWSRDAPPPSSRVGEAWTFFKRFAREAKELDRSRPLRDWVDWLHGFLESDPWGIEGHVFHMPEDRFDVARLDAAGLAGARRIVRQWHDALDTWGGGEEELGVAAFESRLREMLSGDAALWTPARRAVQVSEGLAAAQRAFDHVFIVGLAGDSFPRSAPRSPVLDEHDRRALAEVGLPIDLSESWERRERELFRVLVAGAARSLTLMVPRADDHGRELAPSSFVEETAIALVGEARWEEVREELEEGTERVTASAQLQCELIPGSMVFAPSAPLVTGPEARESAGHAAHIERDRRTGRLSAYNGRIETPGQRTHVATKLDEDYVWSPTQLEHYAKCPWAWFSQRLLRLEHLADPDIDIDPIARGSILHDAMRRFYSTAGVRTGGPVFLRDGDREWARGLLSQVLDEAIADAGPTAWLGAPALRATKRAELHRMLEHFLLWEIEHNEQLYNKKKKKRGPQVLRTGVVEHELAFGMAHLQDSYPEVVIDRAGVRFRLRGSVDRVEQGVDERLDREEALGFIAAVDYKTSKWSAPGGGDKAAWEDGVVLQVPLYALTLQRLRPGTRVARVEYRAFRHAEVQHPLDLYQIDKKTGELIEDADAHSRMDTALDDAARHIRKARAAEFPAHPAPSCGCPPFCHALDICRVAMGPGVGHSDNAWKRAAAMIRESGETEGGGAPADRGTAAGDPGAAGDAGTDDGEAS